MTVMIIVGITLIVIITLSFVAITISDECYNKDYPLMRYGFNGTEHKQSYIKCMDEYNLNPQSLPIRIIQGRIVQ